jgi:cytoskeletal protein CcmA (bactofilin family)
MPEKNGFTSQGLHTVIGAGTLIEGTMKVEHDVRVDGTIKGKLLIAGDLIVGNTGVIEADVEVRSTKLGGKVIGNLNAREKIELEQNASVFGDIRTKDLVINEGAVFQGNCSMHMDREEGKK